MKEEEGSDRSGPWGSARRRYHCRACYHSGGAIVGVVGLMGSLEGDRRGWWDEEASHGDGLGGLVQPWILK